MGNLEVLLLEPAKTILTQIGQFLVTVIKVVLVLLVGWLIARAIKVVVIRILRAIKFDDLSERIALDELLARGGIKYSISELIGVICYWLVLLVTMVVAVNAIGLTVAADLLNRIVLYIPNVVAAIFILILGMFVATFLRNIVQTAATNAGLSQANLISKIVEVVVVVFAIAIALEQLNIGAKIIELTITILLGSLGLAVALAFGLGCKDLAGRFLAELIEKLKTKK